MVIDNKYNIGQMVYLNTDTDQLQRLVTQIIVKPDGLLVYELSCGSSASDHYEFEITEQENELIKVK